MVKDSYAQEIKKADKKMSYPPGIQISLRFEPKNLSEKSKTDCKRFFDLLIACQF
jgi:hypothetical protein